MNGDIAKIGKLSLSYKTFIDRTAMEDEIEICAWNDNRTKYTIASFEYDYDNECYYLESIGDRLNSKDIDWEVFGILVLYAYKLLSREA